MFGGNFAPVGWAFCNGGLVSIDEFNALFALIGTTYGGDGQNTFGLPDLRGRVPIHYGNRSGITYTLGESGGAEAVALTTAQIPGHSHVVNVNADPGASTSPAGNVWAASPDVAAYGDAADTTLHPNAVAPAGANQAHDNMAPFLGINFIIALEGIFPSPN